MTHHNKQLLYPLLWLCLWLLSLLALNADASTNNDSSGGDSVAQANSWKFDVFLDDSNIGYHDFSSEIIDGIEHITSEAEFNVRFMFFTVYHYRHSNQEQWRNGCLLRLESSTDDNGDKQFVKLSRDNKQSRIETGQTLLTTEDCIRSFSYWNLSQLDASTLLNSQTGELMNVSLEKLGTETLDKDQSFIEASKYKLVGKDIEITLWYTQDNQWLALQSITKNGSLIRYQLKPATSQDTSDQSRLDNRERTNESL